MATAVRVSNDFSELSTTPLLPDTDDSLRTIALATKRTHKEIHKVPYGDERMDARGSKQHICLDQSQPLGLDPIPPDLAWTCPGPGPSDLARTPSWAKPMGPIGPNGARAP